MIVAGTGHRPNKLGGYSPDATDHVFRVAQRALEEFLAKDPDLTVISGMALGWDSALAFGALELGLPLICAIPFAGQERAWPTKSQDWYHKVLRKATEVVIVSPGGYSSEKMQIRNEYMVDHSDHIAALWNGTPGGTSNCLRYARLQNKPTTNFWEDFLK